MTISITSLGEPVKTIRQWTYGLTPTPAGNDTYYVEMTCQAGSDLSSQWTVIKLGTGEVTGVHYGPVGVYANSNFRAGGAHGGDMNQLRGPRGELYFVLENLLDPDLRLAMFEPMTGKVYQLSTLVDRGALDALVYSATFNADGSILYFGGQSSRTRSPTVWSFDTRTMRMEIIGHVGLPAATGITYDYYLAVDTDHLYVAVGQNPWQLVSIDLKTRAQTTLITTSGPGWQWMEFEPRWAGFAVHYHDNGVPSRQWLADGKLYPFGDGLNPPFASRVVTPYVNPLPANTWQIDASGGAGIVRTRPAGSADAWREIRYDVANEVPVEIESLVALPDGSIFGNARNYGGSFRARDGAIEWYGIGGLSQPCHVVVGDKLYTTGYPNGALYMFDPFRPWDVDSNPMPLGNFHLPSDMKYPYVIIEVGGVLYCMGRCERDAVGSAIGRYDIATGTFTGTHLGLAGIAKPRGFAVLPDLIRIALSGLLDDGTGAIVHFIVDARTGEIMKFGDTQAIPGLGMGPLFRTATPQVLLSVAPGAAYHYDVSARAVLDSVPIDVPSACAQAPDGMVWFVSETKQLKTIDPNSLLVVDVADLSAYNAVREMAWSGADLYLAAGATLLRVSGL